MSIDPTIVAASIVTVIAAIAAAAVTIINAVAASKDRQDSAVERRALYEKAIIAAKVQDDTSKKADTLIEKATEIHAITNSANANLQRALDVMTEKYSGLLAIMAQVDKAKTEATAAKTESDLAAARLLEPGVRAHDRRAGDTAQSEAR